MQAELGETAVTGVVSVSVSEEGSEAHFEAFQAHDPHFSCSHAEPRRAW